MVGFHRYNDDMAKQQSKFLALLRGINVGGKNVIAKDDLRACFEALGFTAVRTYIQSGNVLFRSDTTSAHELTAKIKTGLSDRFCYDAQAVILSRRQFNSAIKAAPDQWGRDDDQKHNALFTLRGITPKKVLASLPAAVPDIETVTGGPGVIFWSASKHLLSKTTMMKLAKDPVYQQVTARNHNTVFKLQELFEEVESGSR